MAWLASPCLACHARLRHEGSNPASGEQHDAQKKKRGIKARPALDPLVSSENPAHRYSSCAKTHRARPRHRMVHLATRTSGRSPQSPHKTESATVVLGRPRLDRGVAGRYLPQMRFLMMIVLFLAAAAVVDTFYYDGRYRQAVWQEVDYQGQQFRYQVDLLVRKVVGR